MVSPPRDVLHHKHPVAERHRIRAVHVFGDAEIRELALMGAAGWIISALLAFVLYLAVTGKLSSVTQAIGGSLKAKGG